MNKKLYSKRFPDTTTLADIHRWRSETAGGSTPALMRLAAIPCPRVHAPSERQYVYFITDGKAVKIGRADHLGRRLAELQTSHHRELALLGYLIDQPGVERDLHYRFARLRIRGEWYQLDQELANFIQDTRAGVNTVAHVLQNHFTVP